MSIEVRRQKKLDIAKEKDFRRGELLGKYMAKILYGQDNRKFEKEYLRKLERNWMKQKGKMSREANGSSRSRNLEERIMLDLQSLDPSFF